ncbi:fmc1p [Saccharomyces arboricola H-6]|uniref:Fmc1p n=1 Tax=Saccharomyces arboricola (strain H-6 / AS 2.3317 / CBS 10644) TaxID=1160507 RepID=J8LMJ4_SACAR|nr:fmc1p [Saccharomyces arboricola H-6]
MDRARVLQSYRGLIRTILKYERPSKVANWVTLQKTMITKLEYFKKQNPKLPHQDTDRQLESWKKLDPEKNKSLNLFISDSKQLRSILENDLKWDDKIAQGQNVDGIFEHAFDIIKFLDSQREYTELVDRYNPGSKLTQNEKIKRTANVVGLDVPA